MTKVLFVCMGNICRSPTAHGIFEKIIKDNNAQNKFEVDSAGTHSYHIGSSPDKRSSATALKFGIDLSKQSARKVTESDFYYYDYLLALDEDNYQILLSDCPKEFQHKIIKLLDFHPNIDNKNVPDPYYKGDFEGVFKLIETACHHFYQQKSNLKSFD
jgi:protein-tyrosine phosphatase